MALGQLNYAEQSTQYDSDDMENVIILSTPDNLWLYTENDNLLVSEIGDPLCIY